ncbi:MAG: inorganic phosphate transporter, partial [Cyclobacteriaceae bacterium]|nr:inorganic phosphate transporter [Cyclobacteriaceae bacterium]
MFDLEISYSILLVVFILAACSFEFVNGFHDTANAVATVIYTNTLKPWTAVIWSGLFNFFGVFYGGIAVAMGIVNLLPVESLIDQNIYHGLSMIGALLISAIFWNLLTWYYGIPCSSSHTLVAAILGVGIAYYLLPQAAGSGGGVNWGKAQEIGLSLLLSPAVGFTLTILLMLLIRMLTRKTQQADELFKEPKKNSPPPLWIRGILVVTCTLVSFFHGSNDGQKGVGLVMLVLIAIVPFHFALDSRLDVSVVREPLVKIENVLLSIDSANLSAPDRQKLSSTLGMTTQLRQLTATASTTTDIAKESRFVVRRDVMLMDKNIKSLVKDEDIRFSDTDKATLAAGMKTVRKLTDYSPTWVIAMISISLGIGTMIGWKRIVKTIGEKIGKEHLN